MTSTTTQLKISAFLAYKSIAKGNKGTSLLTILIMALAFVNLMFMSSLFTGLTDASENQVIETLYSNIVIEPKDEETYIKNPDSILKKVDSVPGVLGTSAQYITASTIVHEEKSGAWTVRSVDPDDEIMVSSVPEMMIAGEYLSKYDRGEIVIGKEIAGGHGGSLEHLSLGGIVVGMITLTGLGLMMSSILIELSHGNLFLLLLMTMVASIILGMGVPPVAAYIILAILVVPALIKMGVYPLAAHLFVFYFGTIAGITPPMAPDAFVAAGIADSPMMKTALTACRLALVIFIVPYMFVYNNALLLVGNVGEILLVCVTAFFGVYALASAAQNYLGGKLPIYLRLALFIGGGCLIYPGWATDLLGVVLVISILAIRAPDLLRRFTIGLFQHNHSAELTKSE